MKMLKVSQCKKNFDFGPLKSWPPHLPAYAWSNELLCAFDADSAKDVVDIPATSPVGVFCDIHPQLSLPELARIYKLGFFNDDDFSHLLEKNLLRFSESLTDLLAKLARTPLAFQNWASDKKLGPKELFVLKAVVDVESVGGFLQELAQKNPSRQIGIQILENGIELFLMGHTFEALSPKGSSEEWAEDLYQIRHPMLHQKILEKTLDLEKLSWPKFISARVIQHQASLVNEVKLHFRNLGELKRNIEALRRVQSEIENHESH